MDPPQYPLYSLVGAQTNNNNNNAVQHQVRQQQQQQHYSILPPTPQILSSTNSNSNQNQNSNSDPLINSRTKVVLDNVKLSLISIEKSFKSLENQLKAGGRGRIGVEFEEEKLNLNLEKGFNSIKQVMKNLINESSSKTLQSLTTLYDSSSTTSCSTSNAQILETLKTDSESILKSIKSSSESTRQSSRNSINKLSEELKSGIAKLGDKFLVELSGLDVKIEGLKSCLEGGKERDLERDGKVEEERGKVEKEREKDRDDRELLREDNEILKDRINGLASEIRLMSTTMTTELSDIKSTLLPLVNLIPTLTKILNSPTPPQSGSTSTDSTNSSNSNLSVQLITPTSAQSRYETTRYNSNEGSSSTNHSLSVRKNQIRGGSRVESFEGNGEERGILEANSKALHSNISSADTTSRIEKEKDLLMPDSNKPGAETSNLAPKSQSQHLTPAKLPLPSQSSMKEVENSSQIQLQIQPQIHHSEKGIDKSESRKFSSLTRNDQSPRSSNSTALPSLLTSPTVLISSNPSTSPAKLEVAHHNTISSTSVKTTTVIIDSVPAQIHSANISTSHTSPTDIGKDQSKSKGTTSRKRTLSTETEEIVEKMKSVSIPVTPNSTTFDIERVSVINGITASKRQRRTIEQEPSQSSFEELEESSPSRVGPEIRLEEVVSKESADVDSMNLIISDVVAEDEEEVETQDEEE